jgi:hypothetical protein
MMQQCNRPLAKVDFRPPRPPILGDLGGIPGFMQEV